MLVKEWDRLTLDGYLALVSCLRRKDKTPLSRLLDTVRTKRRAGNEPPFADDPSEAVRMIGCTLSDLKPDGSQLCSPVVDLKGKPAEFAEFLAGEAHEELAFTFQPLLLAHFPCVDGSARLIGVQAGRTGRKYARSKREAVDFLGGHPDKDSVLSDVSLRFRLPSFLKDAAELETFIDEAPDIRLDALIDSAELTKEYLFDPGPFGAEIAAKKDWFFELNADTKTTLDFQAAPASDYRPVPLPLGSSESELTAVLGEILAFAKKAGVEDDATSFSDGLQLLREGLRPPDAFWSFCGLAEDRQRILMAALLSDNFAGMASWNDVQIDKDAIYRRLSNQTVFCILQAVCAAASAGPS